MLAGLLNETNFNSTHVQEYKVPHFPFPIWRDESMHGLLMQMARCVADLIKETRHPDRPPGNVLRTLIRVDVVLTEQQGQVCHPCTCMYVMHVSCTVCMCLVRYACVLYGMHVSRTVCMCLVRHACVLYGMHAPWSIVHCMWCTTLNSIDDKICKPCNLC